MANNKTEAQGIRLPVLRGMLPVEGSQAPSGLSGEGVLLRKRDRIPTGR